MVNALLLTLALAAPQQQPADEAKQRLAQAQKVLESGDVAQAVSLLEAAAKAAPQSSEAHLALGRALDLRGDHAAARRHIEQAISLATDETRNGALMAMAISWAFESKAAEAARYYQRVFDSQAQVADNTTPAAGTANALGRIFLESGDLAKAEQWYRTGYETSKRQPDQSANQLALWEMRWHNAQARIAARRKQPAEAQKHVAEVKALLDKGGNDNQRVFFPYLTGYVAFFAGDYKRAVEELLQGDQKDPFVAGLIAQAYDRMGDKAKAREYYEKVLALPAHSINAAFSWPQARKYLKR
jgi:Flp pilus assembly protein TadD